MRILISTILCLALALPPHLQAQKYMARSGKITFFSDAPLEDIKAVNKNATAVLDSETGRMEFAVLIKAFQFEKAKMQEDFNENFMESSEYPKATFKGKITDWESVNMEEGGSHEVKVSGDITIHGKTQPLETSGTLQFGGDKIDAHSTFILTVADFGIEVPSVVRKKIAEEVEVTVDVTLEPMRG